VPPHLFPSLAEPQGPKDFWPEYPQQRRSIRPYQQLQEAEDVDENIFRTVSGRRKSSATSPSKEIARAAAMFAGVPPPPPFLSSPASSQVKIRAARFRQDPTAAKRDPTERLSANHA
jgi:hypothetical protein